MLRALLEKSDKLAERLSRHGYHLVEAVRFGAKEDPQGGGQLWVEKSLRDEVRRGEHVSKPLHQSVPMGVSIG